LILKSILSSFKKKFLKNKFLKKIFKKINF